MSKKKQWNEIWANGRRFLCLALVYANPLYANPLTFGPGTGFFSVTSYANLATGYNGLEWGGYVYGNDSLGQSYSIFDEPGNGPSNGAYLAYDHNANDWTLSSMTTAYGALYSWWDSSILFADSSLFALGIRQGTNSTETLSQASNGAISLAIEGAMGCMTRYPYYCMGGGTENLVLNLQDDPVMLSSLANGQSVALSVTGGCVTSGTSCDGTSPVSSIPEPPTLVLFGPSLFLISYIYRRKKAAA